MAKAEAVEFVRRGVRRMKDRAQLIVDDIEVNKWKMTNKLDGAGPTCEEAQWALSTIQSSDVDLYLYADNKRHPPHLVERIMDCVLLMFQRPLDTVDVDEDRNCIKPSWNQSLKVRSVSCFCQIVCCLSFHLPYCTLFLLLLIFKVKLFDRITLQNSSFSRATSSNKEYCSYIKLVESLSGKGGCYFVCSFYQNQATTSCLVFRRCRSTR